MSGKQFTYYLAPSDQIGFEEAARGSGDVAFIRRLSRSEHPEEVSTTRILAMGKEHLGLLIARRVDLPGLKFSPVGARNEFSCDPLFTSVVEFGRCYVTEQFIRAARMYRVDKYWDENKQLVSKPDAFIEWADRLHKLAKASLTKVEQGCYAGAEALELRKAGVAFEGLDIEVGSIKG
jgi:hypothetical protein